MQQGDQPLDLGAVSAYLGTHLDGFGGPLTARKFDSGQSNPTYLLTTPDRRYVLRRKPPGALLKSAHAVDREFRVQRALAGTAVPVARMYVLCEDEAVIGSAFYVMEYLDGRLIGLPTMAGESTPTRAAIIDEMNRVLAELHMVDVDSVGLADFGPPGNYFERQIGRWTKQYRASQTGVLADMDALIDALGDRMPPDDGQRTLVHGDYRIDNMIFAHDRPVCIGVLDWELSTIGHPFADLGAVIMQWQMPPGNPGRGLAGVDRAALGLPEDHEFVDRYCRRRDLDGIDGFGFYLSFNFFRMAAILQGVYRRALDGNASNPEYARRLGAHVPEFARQGLAALAGGG